MFFFFKQKTAYEMRISDWSSDVCSSDLAGQQFIEVVQAAGDQVLHAVLAFEHTVDAEHAGIEQFAALLEREIVPDDDVDQAGFVLAGEKGDAAGGLWALAHGDQTGVADKIGRASCRERVCQYAKISVVACRFKKKQHTKHTERLK